MRRAVLGLIGFVLAAMILSTCTPATAPPAAVPTQTAESPASQPAASPEAVTVSAASPTPAPASPTPTRPAATFTPMSAQAAGDWPMFRFSLDRAGYNPHETRVRPPLELEWQFEARSKI